jgi:hypothetical protein
MLRLNYVVAAMLYTASAAACSIPVFRYALERWESDRFQVIVFHDGPLAVDQAAALDKLRQQSAAGDGSLNIEVIRFDVGSGEPPKLLQVDRPPPSQPLPYVEIRARRGELRDGLPDWSRVWQGSLLAALKQPGVFDSPVRQEIASRILQGHSAVWLYISPDEHPGNERAAALQETLDQLAQSMRLPDGIGLAGSELHSSVPLEIRFSVLTLRHQDAAEKEFLNLLAANAKTWKHDEPYLIPIFGRCRALEIIPYSETNDGLIEDISSFICGACSCQVKQANPGFDLLVSTNWEEKLFGRSEPIAIQGDSAAGLGNQGDAAPASGSEEPDYVAIPVGQEPGEVALSDPSGPAPATEASSSAVPAPVRPAPSPPQSRASSPIIFCSGLVLVLAIVAISMALRTR